MTTRTPQAIAADTLAKQTKDHWEAVNAVQKKSAFYIKSLLNMIFVAFFVLLFRRLEVRSLFSTDGLLILFGAGIYSCFEFLIFRTERRMNALVALLQEHKLLDFPTAKSV